MPANKLKLLTDQLRTWCLLLRTCEEKILAQGMKGHLISLKVSLMVTISRANQKLFGKEPITTDRQGTCKDCGHTVNLVSIVDGTCIECINDNFDEWLKTGKFGY